jgi:polysaccharide export outer membrane protein
MRFVFVIWLIVLSQLTACTVIPGMHMNPFATRSSIEVPVTENNKTTLKKLNIKLINAQLILDLEKDFNNRSLGKDNIANHYFDHKIGSKTVKEVPEQAPYYQYAVGPRDILSITVWEHPELTIPAGEFRSADAAGTVVGEDGNIFYPYAGIIKAAGRAVEAIRAELVQKLSKFIEMVQLDVRVTAYRSQRIYVVGEVTTPGIQTVKDIPLTVLEAINAAGGATPLADLRNLTLTREDKTYSINLLALYEGGDLRQNVLLKHGDVLNVPDSMFNKIFVLGDTTVGGSGSGRGRSVMMNKGRMTLAEVLSDAGGVNQETSDPARIFVFRTGINKPEIFHLDAKSPDSLLLADRFPMQPRDVVYVDRAEGVRWNQIIAQIQPTVSLLNTFGTIKMEPFKDASTNSSAIPCIKGLTC